MKKKIFYTCLILLSLLLLFAALEKPEIRKEKCSGCGDCVQACPVNAISIKFGKACLDQEKCINCKLCLRNCTYNAIE